MSSRITMMRRAPVDQGKRLVSLAKSVLLYAGLVVGLLVFCIPPYYMATTSVKAEAEVFAIPIHWLPEQFSPTNYLEAFHVAPFGRYFLNSALEPAARWSSPSTSARRGFGLAKYRFSGETPSSLILSPMCSPTSPRQPSYVLVNTLGGRLLHGTHRARLSHSLWYLPNAPIPDHRAG